MPTSTVGAGLSNLAEAVLGEVLSGIDTEGVPFAVIAMGRFGGAELSYASDLDVLFVFDGSTASDAESAERTARRSAGWCGVDPGPRACTPVDAGLRPEGKQGPLARSLDAYASTTTAGPRRGSGRR